MVWYRPKKRFINRPTFVFVVERNSFTEDFVKGLVDTLTWFYDAINPKIALENRVKGYKNLSRLGEYYLRDAEKFMETKSYEDVFEYDLWGMTDRLELDWFFDDNIYFLMFGDAKSVPASNIKKVNRFIEEYKRAIAYSKSIFSWGGDFYYLLKFQGQDARKHFFPVTFYGEKMVEVLGREKLLSAPVWKVEELGGGVLLQVQENPFLNVDKKDLKKVEEYLNLSEAYGGLII